jgi:hypothetical protein
MNKIKLLFTETIHMEQILMNYGAKTIADDINDFYMMHQRIKQKWNQKINKLHTL